MRPRHLLAILLLLQTGPAAAGERLDLAGLAADIAQVSRIRAQEPLWLAGRTGGGRMGSTGRLPEGSSEQRILHGVDGATNRNSGLLAGLSLAAAGVAGAGLAYAGDRNDKAEHALAGYLLALSASGTYTLMAGRPGSVANRVISLVLGVGTAAAVGSLKEVRDRHRADAQTDRLDAYVTLIGGVGGAVTISIADWWSLRP